MLFGAAPTNDAGGFLPPSYYFEFDGASFNRVSDPPNSNCPTYITRLLLLPNGDVMFCREDDSAFYAYHSDTASPDDAWRPIIQACPVDITPGTTIAISGLQFNGLSQAVGYGDDSQAATNYPLVRIVNTASRQVRYCRTHDHSTAGPNGGSIPSMGVATGAAVITTLVDIPGDLELGESALAVVANGIPSQPFVVNITGVILN
jgi:hypothetical protein